MSFAFSTLQPSSTRLIRAVEGPAYPVASIATMSPDAAGSDPSAMHWAAPISGSSSVPVATGARDRTTARLNATISSYVADAGSSGRSALRRFWRWSRARTVNVPRSDAQASSPRRAPSR